MKIESQPENPIVPIEYAGKWIAWNHEGTRIVASGRTFEEVVQAAKDAGELDPIFRKAPKADVRLVPFNRHLPAYPKQAT
jgi:hypothetical protein